MMPTDVPAALPVLAEQWQATLQWCPTEAQQALFQSILEGIWAGNQQMNLTRITEPTEFWEKHLWDSLSGIAPWLQATERPEWVPTTAAPKAIDIGTGAGFPGLPVAIACPTWHVTLLDSTQKKVRFLVELAQTLGLENVRAIADRAEFLAHQPSHREQYDLALLRAVGPAATCAEYALPLVKVGGLAILYRGQWTDADAQQLASAAEQLGGRIVAVLPWQTPLTQGVRHCVYLAKCTVTDDDFPRPAGIPAKSPLV
ncbi:MAG TPA: 16S rRNA (guanine(527)-N(7))-methyltransferase RsmG [Candidatus Obscuribacterales bacterium]